MIIFMGGAPHAGKSEFLKSLLPELEDVVLLDPKSLLPEDYAELSETERAQFNIACWETCLEELDSLINNSDNKTMVILDTTASKASYMRQYFTKAKIHGHKVVYIPVIVNRSLLEERANGEYLGDEMIDTYMNNLQDTIPTLAKLADRYFKVDNNKTKVDLKNRAINIARLIKRI